MAEDWRSQALARLFRRLVSQARRARRRNGIGRDVREARAEHERGDSRSTTPDELMREILS